MKKYLKELKNYMNLQFQLNFFCMKSISFTHGLILMHIAAMAYFINALDSQSSGRGRGGPNYFKVEDLF